MAQKIIDNVVANPTPKSMMQAIDDNFTELYASDPSVWAYISVPAATTIVAAGTLYPIQGTFVNSVNLFSAATALPPGIKYDGTATRNFVVDLHAEVKADRPNSLVTVAVRKNGVLVAGSSITTQCRVAGSPYALSSLSKLSLATGDEVQLVTTTDGAGDEVTFSNIQTVIRPFK